MNRYTITIAGSICFLLMAIVGSAQQPGTLVIEASNFESDEGIAIVNLFREQDDVPKKPFTQATGEIMDGKAKIVFNSIPYGEYAAILFQDENSNGILDHKWGFPNEPMGFSNEWRLTLFSGMPTFIKLKFEFSAQKPGHKIIIKR
jgi:uncharacterized protein (DUF2141 family)